MDFEYRSNNKIIEKPFNHIIYDDFFSSSVYLKLCDEFQNRLSYGLYSESQIPHRFVLSKAKSERGKGYGAYIVSFPPKIHFPMSIFFSKSFFNFFALRFEINLTNDLVGCFHHHPVNSPSGWIHNDFHCCNFRQNPLQNGLNPLAGDVDYMGAADYRPGVVRPMRAIAIIYYLNNCPWSSGDGGETGLFANKNELKPLVEVAPINNRLLAFEITPNSYHAFLSNIRNPRNSVAMWFHAEEEYIRSKHLSK